ncbi:MAG: ATP-dependent DNA ligase [bacterium]|nr:ATP-dependent DNA ligase [bacterium]MDE0289126.1 ATP-dependent DNA ligase [bacterium]
MLKLADVVATSRSVASTRSRRAKINGLADLLGRAAPDEIPILVGFLTGEPRQGRVGIGAASLWAVKPGPADEPELEVIDVDQAIGRIPGITGRGSRARRLALLADLLGRATLEEQEFLRRLLIGELRQGALEGLMMDAVAAASGIDSATVRRAAMLGGELGSVAASALTDGEAALRDMRIIVLRPVRPMLAVTSGSVEDALESTGTASVEWKLDGARIQVHRAGSDTAVFTRSLNDVTGRMPMVRDVVLGMELSEVVLDGEALTHDEHGLPRRFEQTMSRFGSHQSDREVPLLPFFFDILHLDGEDLIDEPLGTRIEVLERVVPAEYRVPRVVTASPGMAERTFAEARLNRHEGVMVKAVDSSYEAGRRGRSWLKIKPAHHLDLVVLAAEWGHGRRTGWLSNLHLGARDRLSGEFVMVGKTFKGLTDEMLTWQTGRFLEVERGRHRNVVFLRPEVVVEVAFDGVLPSPVYEGGVALRFARVKRYRTDKTPAQADTIQSIRRIFEGRA